MTRRANEKDVSLAALTPPFAGSDSASTGPAGGNDGRVGTGPFVSGHLFAGRYRMVTRLGYGGMGQVWRADDLVLRTPVALKVVYSTSEAARQRILNEVRLARQITHPAVCRVFDVGEAEGEVFYSMELVDGEDLSTLLRRVGRLPLEKVIEIGAQLSEALAAAHAQGVLHRDLKPANILIDADGAVRITDFGIAVTRGDSADAAMVGTPAYMAPEQLTPGRELTEQTDLYALGAVLYELVVGQQPFEGRTRRPGPPIKPSALVPDVGPRLERVILSALSPDPRRRPASAAVMAAQLGPAAAVDAHRVMWPWVAGAVVTAAVILIALLAPFVVPGRGAGLTDQDTLVLADFTNTTGEPVFDGALKVALAVALEQSPFLKVFPDDRMRETLGLMQRRPDERVTRAIAREIAQREQLKALVSGSIGSLGTHYVVALEAVNAESGDVMAREQVEATSKEDVLTALGGATSRLREKLGESLASINRFDTPLPRATTSSLEALHAYALALDQGRMVPRLEAIPYLQRALEIDPNFALAQALLSGVYANYGRSADAPVFSRKAFELRDRVSERERFFISWRYYVDAAQAWDKALELAQAWTKTYPREAFAFNSLGMASAAFGQHERAVVAFREATRLDPRFVPPYRNLPGSLIALNRFDEAKGSVRDAGSLAGDSTGLRGIAYTLAFLGNDASAMARALEQTRSTADAMWAANWEARTALFAGRFRAAHDLLQRDIQVAFRDGPREVAAQWSMEDAESHAIAGQCDQALREASAGLALSRDNFTLERAGRSLALCGEAGQVAALSAELTSRFPAATLTNRLQVPVMAAALALQRRDPSKAVTLLGSVGPFDDAPSAELWPGYLRAQAYLARHDPAAGAEFARILAHRGEAPSSPLYPLAQLGAARAARAAGDLDAAGRGYNLFFSLWKNADSDLPALVAARREYALLR